MWWVFRLNTASNAIATVIAVCLLIVFSSERSLAACSRPAHSVAGLPNEIIDLLVDSGKGKEEGKCLVEVKEGLTENPAKPHRGATGFKRNLTAIEGEFVKGEVVAVIRGDTALANEIAGELNLNVLASTPLPIVGGLLVRFGIGDKRPVSIVRALVDSHELVIGATANHIYRLNAGSKKLKKKIPRFSLKAVQIEGVSEKGRGVKIAIIDSDVDDKHPGLNNAVRGRFDALEGAALGNLSHGTGIALLIGGGEPFQGFAPEAELYIARAFDVDEAGASLNSVFAILRSLQWAETQGVQIINMSFAGAENKLLTGALSNLSSRGIILVAAAGNGGARAPYAYPAASEFVFAVTAVDAKNKIYAKANQGAYVFVSAPGVDVMVLSRDEKLRVESGTSFGAAIFTGISALILERFGTLGPDKFRQIVEKSAKDLGATGRDKVYGVGLVQVSKMLKRSK